MNSNLRWLLTALAATAFVACNTTPTTPPAGTDMTVQEARTLSNDPVAQSKPSSSTASFDFKGSVTEGPSKGTTLEGTLSIELKSWRDGVKVFMGGLVTKDARYPVRGVLLKDTRIFVFFEIDPAKDLWIIGQGKTNTSGAFEGTFDGPMLGQDSGTWTATPSTAPPPPPPTGTTTLNYDFSATVTSGPNKGTTLAGKLELTVQGKDGGPKPASADSSEASGGSGGSRGIQKFTGTLTLTDGTKVPVKGMILCGKRVVAVFQLAADGSKLIFGEGVIAADGSVKGPFAIIDKSAGGDGKAADVGTWTAKPITPAP